MKNLIIVESPTKAKTINKFLGKDYKVISSLGHIRDLPKSKMGIDIEHDFEPHYVIPRSKSKTVTELKQTAKKYDQIYFATDEDREGEAIAWHLAHILEIDPSDAKRIVFHEITKEAIITALETPRTISQPLVDAQQARRILDRLVGYELSPLLWKKVARGLSAGRVQSVAVRLIVEREREIEAFKAEEYWTISADLAAQAGGFNAKLAKKDGKTLDKFALPDKQATDKVLSELQDAQYTVAQIEAKEVKKSPYAPFTTSTLQQAANRILGYSAKQTMRLAQQLYEGIKLGAEGETGLITYMRTDSLNLANKFLTESSSFIKHEFGDTYAHTRKFKTKAKGAQEAHEAIRPTEVTHTPESIKEYLDSRQYKLYKLIWQRAVASQMSDAKLKQTSITITAKNFEFRASGSVIDFPGWLTVYPDKVKEEELPEVTEGETLKLEKLIPEQHFTQPPARYSEASLIKALEEKGIGRPSTYAPTISTIQERNYVVKEENRLKPTDIGILVNDLLVEHFTNVVDYDFTAGLEENLDEIAEGQIKWQPIIKDFYNPFKQNLDTKQAELSKKEITEEKTDETCEKCGGNMVIKTGRFGRFLACSNYPDCKNTKEINGKGEIEAEEKIDETCEKCGAAMVKKRGRFGEFLACSNYPDCKNTKAIVKSTGVKCPECGKGEIVEKRSKRGRYFYGCSNYPSCKFALWSKPTGETCPECGSLLTQAKNGALCSNKECAYKTS